MNSMAQLSRCNCACVTQLRTFRKLQNTHLKLLKIDIDGSNCNARYFSTDIIRNQAFSDFMNPSKPDSKTHSAKRPSLIGRNLISLMDLGKEEIQQLIWTARDLKIRMKDGGEPVQLLQGKTAVLYFDQPDLTTRLAVENGLAKLGGHLSYCTPEDVGNLQEAASVFSSLSDLIVTCVTDETDVSLIADQSRVPVLSGLTNLHNCLKVLTYFMTIQEYFGALRGYKIAFVGEGGPTLNSLLQGCAKLGVDLNTATPPGSESDVEVMLDSMEEAGRSGAEFKLGDDPLKAVYRADAVIWDTGRRSGGAAQPKYQISRKMLQEAGGSWVFLHDLGQRSGGVTGVTEDILRGEESLARQACQNRLWMTMSVLLHLLVPYQPIIEKPKFVRG